MKALFLTDKLIMGGAEMYFCRLENALRPPIVDLYTAAAEGELVGQLADPAHFTPLSRTNHWANLQLLRRHILTHDITLIHANSLRMTLYAIALKQLLRQPLHIVHTRHNITMLDGRLEALLVRLLNTYVDCVITVNEFDRRQLMKSGVQAGRIATVHNGVDLEQFTFLRKQSGAVFKIGILARLSPEKNHALFLRIAALLHQQQPGQFQFVIGGDGPERQKLQELTRELRLTEIVQFRGAITAPESFIQEMDALLLTSEREVFPLVVLEAMASGTPIIAIDRGGIAEAITDGKTGFLVPRHDPYLFAAKVQQLCTSRTRYEDITTAARRMVEERFSLQHMVERTLQVYKNCLLPH